MLDALVAFCGKIGRAPRRLEKMWHSFMRSEGAFPKSLVGALVGVIVLGMCFPLFLTGETSFGRADDVCRERHIEKLRKGYDEGDYTDIERDAIHASAGGHLLPGHVFNSISTVVSLLGFTTWLFHSPHTSNVAVDLDRTCNSPPLSFPPLLFLLLLLLTSLTHVHPFFVPDFKWGVILLYSCWRTPSKWHYSFSVGGLSTTTFLMACGFLTVS
jgi:hypothetical protein